MRFGEAFGKLVKKLRGVEGLTQEELAVKAFGEGSYKTRISELENGRVSNPQAKTVDPLIVALNISKEEMDDARNFGSHPRFIDNLIDFFEPKNGLKLYIEIAANKEGKVYLFHDGTLKVKLKRAEFFCEERELVLLSSEGRRRRCGVKLVDILTEQILKGLGVTLVLINPEDKNQTTEGITLPIKIVE